MTDIVARIREYLGNGGLFNPECMDHAKVRDMVMDCRDEIERLRAERDAAVARMSKLDFERTAAEIERDALRELLKEARDKISGAFVNRRVDYDVAIFTASAIQDVVARIDAVLEKIKGGGDE